MFYYFNEQKKTFQHPKPSMRISECAANEGGRPLKPGIFCKCSNTLIGTSI